jgi:hypothetical protein
MAVAAYLPSILGHGGPTFSGNPARHRTNMPERFELFVRMPLKLQSVNG